MADNILECFPRDKENNVPVHLIFSFCDFLRLNVEKFDSLLNYSNVA